MTRKCNVPKTMEKFGCKEKSTCNAHLTQISGIIVRKKY
jgi:hypothetical protein